MDLILTALIVMPALWQAFVRIYSQNPVPIAFGMAVFIITPFVLTTRVCRNRNRSVLKGLFVTVFTSWIGTTFLWLALRRREPSTGQLL